MSTWFKEDSRSWVQKIFGNILKAGPLPKHVAIIMDGNRRFAKNHNLQKIEGHKSGFDKLVEVSCVYEINKLHLKKKKLFLFNI